MMVLLILSISANIYLTYHLKAAKSLLKDRQPSIELDEFIADLLNGNGIVKITRINPHDIFLRSPRARR